MTIELELTWIRLAWVTGVFLMSFPLARLCESCMNAEQFTCPKNDRSVLWHRLKYGVYGFGFIHGASGLLFFTVSAWITGSLVFGLATWLAGELLSIAIAWIVFETFLSFFRGIIKCQS